MKVGLRLFAFVIVALVALAAGCTKSNPSPTTSSPTNGGTTSSPPTATTPPTGTTSPTSPTPSGPCAAPTDVNPPKDEGDIQGPFTWSKTWTVKCAGWKAYTVKFVLSGFQGAPSPLATVNLELRDSAKKLIKSVTVGVGGSGNDVTWALSASDVPTLGDFTLAAVASQTSNGEVPSGGVAHYLFTVSVTY